MKKFYLLIAILFFYFNANSQFTYFNVSGGYEGLSLKSSFSTTLTGVKSFSTSITAISRLKRHFGIGAKASFALEQNFKYSYKDANYFGNSTFTDKHIKDPADRYYAQKFDYNISYTNTISIFGRIYFDTYVNAYSDIKISYLKVNESFTFIRAYVPSTGFQNSFRPEIPEVNANYDEDKNLISPGIRFGLSPHITDHLYLDFNLGIDFLFFGSSGFEYIQPYKYDIVEDWHNFARFTSQAVGTKTLFSINIGVGYYF